MVPRTLKLSKRDAAHEVRAGREGPSGGLAGADDRAVVPEARIPPAPAAGPRGTDRKSRGSALERTELRYLRAVLRAADGKIDEAARQSGIAPRSPYGKKRR
jgi:hypothetical protein